MHSFIHSLIRHLFIHSFIYLLMHSLTHSAIHLFLPSLQADYEVSPDEKRASLAQDVFDKYLKSDVSIG